MKIWVKWAILSVFVILFFAQCSHGFEFHLGWNAAFVPPHNEPVVGNKVARYRFQFKPIIETKWLEYNGEFSAWGVNTWTSPNSHISSSWSHDNWNIEEVRYTTKHIVYLGQNKSLRVYSEFYQPINSADWGKGGSSMGDYWWLVGLSGRLW